MIRIILKTNLTQSALEEKQMFIDDSFFISQNYCGSLFIFLFIVAISAYLFKIFPTFHS